MTWNLTPEEEFNPLLLPPIAMQYPRPLPSAAVPYIVGSPDLNKWYSGEGYSGPLTPVMGDQRPVFDEKLLYGRGKFPSSYQADYPQSFFPEVVDSYEAIFNRQPAASNHERMWAGSDVRFDFDFAPRRQQREWGPTPGAGYQSGSPISGLGEAGDAVWYETPVGSIALGAGVGVLSYLATRAFLRSRARR
jgi:hypothetical protein